MTDRRIVSLTATPVRVGSRGRGSPPELEFLFTALPGSGDISSKWLSGQTPTLVSALRVANSNQGNNDYQDVTLSLDGTDSTGTPLTTGLSVLWQQNQNGVFRTQLGTPFSVPPSSLLWLTAITSGPVSLFPQFTAAYAVLEFA